MVSAGVVGRYAPLTAGPATALIANLVLAALTAPSLLGNGMAGALAFGAAWVGTGMFFAAVAAVTAQLTENSRTANGLAFAVLGTAFVLRAAGDAGGSDGPVWLSWLSPIGWAQQVRPYGEERWWVPALFAVGAGLLPPRPGPAAATPSLRTPLALAWRLHRGTLAAWTAAFAAYGLVIGGVVDSANDLIGDSADTRELISKMGASQNLTDAFLNLMFGTMAIIASVHAVQAMLRLRAEETRQRAEPLLAASVTRIRWAAGHALISLAGTAVLMLVAGLTTGLTYGVTAGDFGNRMSDALSGTLVQIPAAWVPAGIALALFGLAPRATNS